MYSSGRELKVRAQVWCVYEVVDRKATPGSTLFTSASILASIVGLLAMVCALCTFLIGRGGMSDLGNGSVQVVSSSSQARESMHSHVARTKQMKGKVGRRQDLRA